MYCFPLNILFSGCLIYVIIYKYYDFGMFNFFSLFQFYGIKLGSYHFS
jgi:hypothetical protein